MDRARDTGIVGLAVLIVACATVFLFGVAQPTTRLLEFLFPRL
jgi:hypothetical protein